MKPNPEYIRKLLTAFEESPEPTTDINELRERGLDYMENEFMFHLRLLNDSDFVEREDGDSGIGLYRSIDGLYSWSAVPLRLTSSGHEFAQAMENEHGFQAVMKSLVSSSLGIMRDIAVGTFKAELTKHGLLL
jgi:hypothetical protein